MDSTIVSEICHCTHGQYNSRVSECSQYQKYVIVHMDSTIVGSVNVHSQEGKYKCHCTHGQYNSIRNMSLYTWTVQQYQKYVIVPYKLLCLRKALIVYQWDRIMVFNATFNNISAISWRPVLLVEKTGVPGENHRPATSHSQTLSHKVVL